MWAGRLKLKGRYDSLICYALKSCSKAYAPVLYMSCCFKLFDDGWQLIDLKLLGVHTSLANAQNIGSINTNMNIVTSL